MDRQLLAYLLLALLILTLAVAFARARHQSRAAVLKRRRAVDEARWAEQAHARANLKPAAGPARRLP